MTLVTLLGFKKEGGCEKHNVSGKEGDLSSISPYMNKFAFVRITKACGFRSSQFSFSVSSMKCYTFEKFSLVVAVQFNYQ